MKTVLRFLFPIFILLVTHRAAATDACQTGFARLASGLETSASRAEKIGSWERALAAKEIEFKVEAPQHGEGYWMYELQTPQGRHIASVEFDFEGEELISIQWQATETRYQRQGAQAFLARRVGEDFPKVKHVTSSLQDTNLALMRTAIASGASDVDAFKSTAVYQAYADAGFGVVDKVSRYERNDLTTGYIFFVSKPR